jgi:hypothetical protein
MPAYKKEICEICVASPFDTAGRLLGEGLHMHENINDVFTALG